MEEQLFEPDSWAVCEVMGHNTFAGKISQHVLGGTAFVRVDVPEIPESTETLYGNSYAYPLVPAFTKLIGASSIYAITPCTEAVARAMARQKRAKPVEILDVSPKTSRLVAAPDETDDDCPY